MLAISKTSKRLLSASVPFLSTFTIIFLTASLVKAADLGGVDLSTALFGNEKRFKFTGAYISDDYYKATGGVNGYHGGIDIGAPIGTEVKTLVSGKVVLVDMHWGLLTIQDANGINHIYKHLSQVLVSQGSSVTAGQKVAKTGITAADAAHFHYEITRKDYVYGALQIPTKKTKEEARQRTYNPFKNYWAMRRI
ncbi:M23 family metallopeptidase [Nostoc sp. ChiSLP03a]|uniref:M23 family metallopeptidase n=1 Tax=Nostoc sp. ChiSLP03a TaxID=3075380 RepID=UPI002AD1F26C|nr:M23 family metallopeptidase [Nostoc sp. ChiSLP03a]MDZ8214456.1 M23 family metallopeptidase [Nostoc sp. ChiSLP03a]